MNVGRFRGIVTAERVRLLAIVWLTSMATLVAGVRQLNAAQERPANASSTEQQDLAALSQLVDAASAGRSTSEVPLTWAGNHFIRSQGDSVYVPFTIAVDRRQLPVTATQVYIRAVARSAAPPPAPKFAWETLQAIEMPADGQFSRAIALAPGTYDVFVAVKEKGVAPGKLGLVRHELTVPSFAGSELSTSSIILARSLEQMTASLPPEKQQDNPYVFGPLKVTPSTDNTFTKAGDLQVLFWIYGASQAAGKPDVQVDYSFHQRLSDGEKYFNRTNPQELNAKTLPAEFNLTMGHQLLSSLSVSLSSFPPGDYRLEIKVTDKPSGKSLTNSVNFAVSAS